MGEMHHIEVVQRLIDVLDAFGIPYAIGGSMASSAYGTMRFTQDADIAVEPFSPVADRFFDMVKSEFYISEEVMRHALNARGSFNLIHFATSFKIDIFVEGPSEFERQLMARRRTAKLAETGQRDLYVVSPEDIILLKLRWFKETGCTSERQWTDVLGVLAVQGEALDFPYLTEWAKKLDLDDLLGRAMAEAST